jgi:hypothetical protein
METTALSPGRSLASAGIRGYVVVLGLVAAMFSLLDLLIIGSAAVATQPAIITMQRSLVNYSEGGGVSIDQLADPLLRLFLLTYVSALVCLLITFGFCWYAGRVAMENTGDQSAATRAGVSVTLTSGLVWIIIGIPAIVLTQADGTISWLVATVGVILATPSGPPISSVYVTSPGGLYLLIQLAALLLQFGVFFCIALSGGAIIARIGTRSSSSHSALAPASLNDS